MPGEPRRAPPPSAVEAWPSLAPLGEVGRIRVSIIVLAFLCSSAGSTVASPGGKNHTWPPTAQTTGLDWIRSQTPESPCFASEFLNHSILQIPSHGPARLTGPEADHHVGSDHEL